MTGRQDPWPTWLPPNSDSGCVADNLINNSEKVSDSILICNHKNSIADSGFTNHYLCTTTPCINVEPCTYGIQVNHPDSAIMTSTHTALIDILHLLSAARHTHIFPQMHNKALLSLGQFCNNDYNVKFTRTTI